MGHVLEMKNVIKKYDDFVLNDFSLSLPYGSIMGLIGENGAGKTTVIKLILNEIRRSSGSIRIFGLDNIKHEQKIKANIGVVFDDCNFHDCLTAQNLSTIMKSIYPAWDEKRYADLVNQLKLPMCKQVKEFSKGMKTKLTIAISLTHQPELLILDEATVGLDPVVRDEILGIFLEYVKLKNRSILFSSHITSDLEKVADYIAFMHVGQLIFSKPKEQILSEYSVVKCNLNEMDKIESHDIVAYRKVNNRFNILVKNKEKYKNYDHDFPSIEDIMLYYIKGEKK